MDEVDQPNVDRLPNGKVGPPGLPDLGLNEKFFDIRNFYTENGDIRCKKTNAVGDECTRKIEDSRQRVAQFVNRSSSMLLVHITSGICLHREGRSQMFNYLYSAFIIPKLAKLLPPPLSATDVPPLRSHAVNADKYLDAEWQGLKHNYTPDPGFAKPLVYPLNLHWMYPCPLTCSDWRWKWRPSWDFPSMRAEVGADPAV